VGFPSHADKRGLPHNYIVLLLLGYAWFLPLLLPERQWAWNYWDRQLGRGEGSVLRDSTQTWIEQSQTGQVFNLDLKFLGGIIHIGGLKFTAAFDLYLGSKRIALSDLTKD